MGGWDGVGNVGGWDGEWVGGMVRGNKVEC